MPSPPSIFPTLVGGNSNQFNNGRALWTLSNEIGQINAEVAKLSTVEVGMYTGSTTNIPSTLPINVTNTGTNTYVQYVPFTTAFTSLPTRISIIYQNIGTTDTYSANSSTGTTTMGVSANGNTPVMFSFVGYTGGTGNYIYNTSNSSLPSTTASGGIFNVTTAGFWVTNSNQITVSFTNGVPTLYAVGGSAIGDITPNDSTKQYLYVATIN